MTNREQEMELERGGLAVVVLTALLLGTLMLASNVLPAQNEVKRCLTKIR
jgi:hypothetical protein